MAVTGWWGAALAQSEPSKSDAKVTPVAIEQQKPSFFVHAEMDRPSMEYWDGEQLTVTVRCEVDAYVYAIYTQADQQSYVVLPNSGSSREKVPAGQKVRIPAESDAFRWTVGAPFGKEEFKIIAAQQRIESLERPELRRGHAAPLTAEGLKALIEEIRSRIPVAEWSEVSLSLTTHEGVNPESPYAGKRHGVFFGVSTQIATQIIKRANEAAKTDRSPSCADLGLAVVMDSLVTKRVFRTSCGLETAECVPDPQKDKVPFLLRDTIKEQITDRLAKKTKPGDTVVIFFSGHGADFVDEDSPGGKTSYLIPADYLDASTLLALRYLDRKGLTDEIDKILLERGESFLQKAGLALDVEWNQTADLSEEQRKSLLLASHELQRRSCVTDIEFMHWLQSLAGRRVIVILHACHSGGFLPDLAQSASKDSSLKALSPQTTDVPTFRFLQPQLGRLKSLGMTNVGLIAAAKHNQSALSPHWNAGPNSKQEPATVIARETLAELVQSLHLSDKSRKFLDEEGAQIDFMGIFTYYLVNSLLKNPGAMDVASVGNLTSQQMADYFQSQSFRMQVEASNRELVSKGEPPMALEELPFYPIWVEPAGTRLLVKP